MGRKQLKKPSRLRNEEIGKRLAKIEAEAREIGRQYADSMKRIEKKRVELRKLCRHTKVVRISEHLNVHMLCEICGKRNP